jgi:hypothetical protein
VFHTTHKISRSDTYAYIAFEGAEGYDKANREDVKIFGIGIKVHTIYSLHSV